MKYYTIGEASIELGINRTTLERRYKRLKIRPRQGDFDKREYFLSERDIEQIRAAYAAKEKRRQNAAQSPQNTKAAMLGEISKLKDRIQEIEDTYIKKTHIAPFRSRAADEAGESHNIPPSSFAPSESHPRASQRHSRKRDNRRTTDYPDMPDHLIGLGRLCIAHGAAQTTAHKQWSELGTFQVEGPYKIGRVAKAWAIDRENALKALQHWFNHDEMDKSTIGQCDIENCPCSKLVQHSDD